jgi:hypothetical protein
MSRRLDDLAQDVEQTRARLDQTIAALRERLSRQLGSTVGATLDVVRRNPIPAILVVAGVGWLARRMIGNARGYKPYQRIAEAAADIPVLNTGAARIYDPDVSPRHQALDSLERRREVSAEVKA